MTPPSFGDHGDLLSASDGKTYMITAECYSIGAVFAVDVSIALRMALMLDKVECRPA